MIINLKSNVKSQRYKRLYKQYYYIPVKLFLLLLLLLPLIHFVEMTKIDTVFFVSCYLKREKNRIARNNVERRNNDESDGNAKKQQQ